MKIDYIFLLFTILFLIIFGLIFFCINHQNSTYHEQSLSKLIFTINSKISLVCGLIFLGIATLFLITSWSLTAIVQINCNRSVPDQDFLNLARNVPTNVCELAEFNWLGYEKSKKIIADLQGVQLETKTELDQENSATYKYQVMLISNIDIIPFRTDNYYKYEAKKYQSVISTIESFLANSLQMSLVFQEDDKNHGYVGIKISLFLELLSLLIVISRLSITCFFDKEVNLMTLTRSRWLGTFGNLVIQHKLDEIVDVKVESIDGDEGFLYRVIFVLNSGEIFPLTHVYSSSSASKYQRTKMIKKFLIASDENVNA